MFQEERLNKIIHWLKKEPTLTNQQIMERLNISRDTARRDIVKLTEDGNAIRTHGGIARLDLQMQVGNYQSRMVKNLESKKRIGKAVKTMLPKKGILFLDVSTYMPFVCDGIPKETKVYTHSLDNLELLADQKDIETHSLGGILNHDNRFFYGYDVWEKLSNITADVAVLGVAAMGDDGIYFEDEEDAGVKALAAKQAKKVIVMADASKFQQNSKFRAVGYDKIDLIVTDKELSKEWQKRFKEEKVQWKVV